MNTISLQQRGISLVELLVGMVIALMAILAITQVFLFTEELARIPTSGANTHINGIVALDALQRDIRHSGYGVATTRLLGCMLDNTAAANAIGLGNTRISPVLIQQGAGPGGSDTITVLSSNKVDASFPITTTAAHNMADTQFVVQTAPTTAPGDWMVVAPTNTETCKVFQVDSITSNGTSSTLSHTTNAEIGDVAQRSPIVNLGPAPYYRRWSVSDNNQLQVAKPSAASASEAYAEIVLMRAFYAKDMNGTGSVDTYDAIAPTTAAEWARVLGVRVAIIARNPIRNRLAVTEGPLQWDLGSAAVVNSVTCASNRNSQCMELSVAGTAPTDEWQFYRYRMFDTMIPMRNLLWQIAL